MPTLDLTTTPFTRSHAWTSLFEQRSIEIRDGSGTSGAGPLGPGWYWRSHHARAVIRRELAKLTFRAGDQQVEPEASSDGSELIWRHAAGEVRACFPQGDELRLRGSGGLSLELQVPTGPGVVAHNDGADACVLNIRTAWRRYRCQRLAGAMRLEADWAPDQCAAISLHLGANDEAWEVAIDEVWSTWPARERQPWAAAVSAIRDEVDAWTSAFGAPHHDPETWWRAAWLLWGCTVPPDGQLTVPAIYMSKHWMDQVWSWDHCFNAVALAAAHPDAAWDQLEVMFAHQDEFGAFPDGLNDVLKHYNFAKPPVHGWAVRELIARAPDAATPARIERAYACLERWQSWWLTHRRRPGQALPHYLHGNDSGWDNSTMFDQGVPLIAPDLAALLVDQAGTLAALAERLGHSAAAADWRQQAEDLRSALLKLWDGTRFVPQRLEADGSHHPVSCQSLVPMVASFLGDRLPSEVGQTIAAELAPHVTGHGLATEDPASPAYTENGYWRGPIWAPSTTLVTLGMQSINAELATTIARDFCTTCQHAGFAENFDALTGAGLCDRAYTWTASAYLILGPRAGAGVT